MDGWCVNAGMDDWLPSKPVKPEERVPVRVGGGGEQSGGGLISKPAKEESVVSFY